MTHWTRGGLPALLLSVPGGALAEVLLATRENGDEIARFDTPTAKSGASSGTIGRRVRRGRSFPDRDGQIVLIRSHLPDVAAGFDHVPGDGRQVSDGRGGNLILDIDEPVPGNAFVLKPGSGAVDHRLKQGDRVVSLSSAAPGERVRIGLIGDGES